MFLMKDIIILSLMKVLVDDGISLIDANTCGERDLVISAKYFKLSISHIIISLAYMKNLYFGEEG